MGAKLERDKLISANLSEKYKIIKTLDDPSNPCL